MKKFSLQQEKVLMVLIKKKLGIRQLLDEFKGMGQRALYKSLHELRRLNLVETESDGYRKFHYLTEKGFEEARKIVAFRTIQHETRNFLYSNDLDKKMCAFGSIFKELFQAFYPEKWDLRGAHEWEKFRNIMELTVKEKLNKCIPKKDVILENRFEEYADPYFVLRSVDGYSLLNDAMLAKELNHYLTENQKDILLKTETVTCSEELEEHNAKWFEQYPSLKKRKDRFGEEEKERDKLLKRKGILSLERKARFRWSRDNFKSRS